MALCRDVVSAKSNFQIQPDRQDQVVAHPPLMLLGKHPFSSDKEAMDYIRLLPNRKRS